MYLLSRPKLKVKYGTPLTMNEFLCVKISRLEPKNKSKKSIVNLRKTDWVPPGDFGIKTNP